MNVEKTARDKYQQFNCSSDSCSSSRKDGIQFGLFLVIGGLLFLLQHFGMLGGYRVVQFWPVLLIMPGLCGVFKSNHGLGKLFSGLLFLAGTFGLLHSLNVIDIPWGVIWPSIILVLGICIMAMVALFPRHSKKELREAAMSKENSDMLNVDLKFGGREIDFGPETFKGGLIDVSMGGVELDLRAANIEQEATTLYVSAFMAGIKVIVPKEWNVKVDGKAFCGAIENSTKKDSVLMDENKNLLIKASVNCGAIEVSN